MKKIRKKKFYIHDHTIQSSCTFLIGHTWDDISKLHKKIKHQDEPDLDPKYNDSNGVCFKVKDKKGITCHVIWMRAFNFTIPKLGVLAHECVHLAGNVLDHKGVPYRIENDEIFAYLVEFYYTEALKELNK